MRRLALAATFLLFAATLGGLAAHTDHDGVVVTVIDAAPLAGDARRVALQVYIANRRSAPITVLGFRADAAAAVRLERQSGAFFWTAWERVERLKIEPNGSHLLGADAFRVIVETDAPDAFLNPGVELDVDIFDHGGGEREALRALDTL